jgi:hypothetical protein
MSDIDTILYGAPSSSAPGTGTEMTSTISETGDANGLGGAAGGNLSANQQGSSGGPGGLVAPALSASSTAGGTPTMTTGGQGAGALVTSPASAGVNSATGSLPALSSNVGNQLLPNTAPPAINLDFLLSRFEKDVLQTPYAVIRERQIKELEVEGDFMGKFAVR